MVYTLREDNNNNNDDSVGGGVGGVSTFHVSGVGVGGAVGGGGGSGAVGGGGDVCHLPLGLWLGLGLRPWHHFPHHLPLAGAAALGQWQTLPLHSQPAGRL